MKKISFYLFLTLVCMGMHHFTACGDQELKDASALLKQMRETEQTLDREFKIAEQDTARLESNPSRTQDEERTLEHYRARLPVYRALYAHLQDNIRQLENVLEAPRE